MPVEDAEHRLVGLVSLPRAPAPAGRPRRRRARARDRGRRHHEARPDRRSPRRRDARAIEVMREYARRLPAGRHRTAASSAWSPSDDFMGIAGQLLEERLRELSRRRRVAARARPRRLARRPARTGPTLVALGGIHGNEPAGRARRRARARPPRSSERWTLRGEFVALAGNRARARRRACASSSAT